VSGATLLHEISRNAYEFIIAKQLVERNRI
jgi:hypothetical protein